MHPVDEYIRSYGVSSEMIIAMFFTRRKILQFYSLRDTRRKLGASPQRETYGNIKIVGAA
jgi:hypothetical protein